MRIETAERLIDRLMTSLDKAEAQVMALESKLAIERKLNENFMSAQTAADREAANG